MKDKEYPELTWNYWRNHLRFCSTTWRLQIPSNKRVDDIISGEKNER